MPKFQDDFKTRKRSFINAFSISMAVPLKKAEKSNKESINIKVYDILLDVACKMDYTFIYL